MKRIDRLIDGSIGSPAFRLPIGRCWFIVDTFTVTIQRQTCPRLRLAFDLSISVSISISSVTQQHGRKEQIMTGRLSSY